MDIAVVPQLTQTKFLTLSQLSEKIKGILSQGLTTEWVQAEIVKLNFYPTSGHCYSELVEKEGNEVKAKIDAVMWRDNFININQKFKNVTNEKLSVGMKVLLRVKVNYHALFGLKLDVIDIEPS